MAWSRVAEKSSRWPVFGVWLSSRRTDGQEAEVGHVVGLVEHGQLDVGEPAVALADEVLEAAGAGDHDVGGLQAADLRVLAHAAEDGLGGEAGGRGERREGRLDLADQLTGRGEDQGARAHRGGCGAGRP